MLLRLDVRDGGMTWADLREALAIEFPTLESAVTESELRNFVARYVDPMVVVPPEFYRKGLMQADANLNAAAEIAKVAERMQRKWEDVEVRVGTTDVDGNGNIVPVGPTEKEWIAMGKDVIAARKEQMDQQARIGMAPEKKSSGGVNVILPATNIQVNLRDAVGGGFGKQAPAPVDASFKEKGEKGPPASPT